MIIIKKNLQLTISDNCSHIQLPFELPTKGSALFINFKFNPSRSLDKKACVELAKKQMAYYAPDRILTDKELQNYSVFKNLVTISLDSPEGYLGSAHRHDNNQQIIISPKESTRGFIKQKIIKGQWIVTVSAHSIISPTIDVEIEVSYE